MNITADVGQLSINLGNDGSQDSISLVGAMSSVSIQNYTIVVDSLVDVDTPSTWSGTDNGTYIVFTQSYQTITFEGLGGVGGSTDPLDYFM